jgi:hypothetical protein
VADAMIEAEIIAGDKNVLAQLAASGATRGCWDRRCRAGGFTERYSSIF